MDFNDVSEKFPFEKLFSVITDSLMVEMKHKDQQIMKFEEAPKILISTNYTIEGHDHSTLDRQFIIEFSDHYNMNKTPVSEFGHRFFENWNTEQWNSFDNFMISCLQFYLENGFVEYEKINLITKKIIAATSEDFLEFMKDKEIVTEYNQSEIHKEFKEQYEDYVNQPQKTFTEWIKIMQR